MDKLWCSHRVQSQADIKIMDDLRVLVGSNLRAVLLSRTQYRTIYIYEKRERWLPYEEEGISTCILFLFARRNTEKKIKC